MSGAVMPMTRSGRLLRIPGFVVEYAPDERQTYADSWPRSIDDSDARRDWGWQPRYDLPAMVEDMLHHLTPKLQASPKEHA